MMPNLPARMFCVASSTGGKSVLIQNLILEIYRGSDERIYIFSPMLMTHGGQSRNILLT